MYTKNIIGKPQLSKNVISVAFDWGRPKDPPLSLGQASILANLNKHNILVNAKAWSVNRPDFKLKEAHRFIMKHANPNSDLALGAYVWHEPQTQKLLNLLRKDKFPGRIILGGPQISYVKRDIEHYYPQADIFIRGYAEQALVQLLQSEKEKPVIAGVHYANDPDLGLSANVELEQLPSPYLTGLIKPQHFLRLETQRGCPFRCAFCQHRESDISMKRRQFSASRIMEEINWILAHPEIQDIAVLDPTFNSGPYYLEILEAFVKGKYSGKLSLQCRIEMVRPEFLDLVQELNKTGKVVLEFGLQTIHRQEELIIQRPNNIKKVEQVLRETKKRNIATEVSLIFGLPGQTVDSFKASIDFCKSLGVPTIHAFPLMLLRGTPLHDKKDELGLVESTDIYCEGIDRIQDNIPHVIASQTFTIEEWRQMADIAASLDSYNAEQQLNTPSSPKMLHTLRHTMWKKPTAMKEASNKKFDIKESIPASKVK